MNFILQLFLSPSHNLSYNNYIHAKVNLELMDFEQRINPLS
jgi:hypothetical protein